MKKYRLIKKYPGSTEVGEIIQGNGREGWYTKGPGCRIYDWTQVVHYPEYWEEVIDLDYEIVSYVAKDNPNNITTKKRGCELHDSYWTIYSVKRLSDGEVFTVGDRIKVRNHGSSKRLDEIVIKNDQSSFREGIWFYYSMGCSHFENTIKVKSPIFLTHDGKDIFEGDTVWFVNKNNHYFDYIIVSKETNFSSERRAYFLTREEAEYYIIVNTKALSIEEFWEFTSKPGSNVVKQKALKELVKERLNSK
jgi:hypothetical protein